MRPVHTFLVLILCAAPALAGTRDCADCPEMVRLPPGFALARTEVTVAQYKACVAGGGCPARAPRWESPNDPMTGVTVRDAEAYAAWLSARGRGRYRLPTAQEWRMAAAAGTVTAYPWGEDMSPDRAVCRGCDPRVGHRPLAVGSMAANPWGLSDMHGNVWEWTADAWPGGLSARAVCGGSWYFVAAQARTESCVRQDAREPSYDIGFRVLKE